MMKIQKAVVEYKERKDIICMYGSIGEGDNEIRYYFLGDDETKKFSNGNRVVTSSLTEAVDPMIEPKQIGMINKKGDVIIPLENRAIKPISNKIILVEKSTPVSQSVIDAVEHRKDSLAVSGLVSTSAAIKDAINAKMGPEGRFIFNDQFSEATVCDIDGNNLVNGEHYSYISMANDLLYLSKNVANSEIFEFSISKCEFVQSADKSNEVIDVNNVGVDPAVVNNALATDAAVQAVAPVADAAVPAVDANGAPVVDPAAMPAVDSNGAPVVDPAAMPAVEGAVAPGMVDPNAVPAVDANGAPVVDPNVVPAVDANGAPVVDPAAMPTVDANGAPVVDPAAMPAVDGAVAPEMPTVDPNAVPAVGAEVTVDAADAPVVDPASMPVGDASQDLENTPLNMPTIDPNAAMSDGSVGDVPTDGTDAMASSDVAAVDPEASMPIVNENGTQAEEAEPNPLAGFEEFFNANIPSDAVEAGEGFNPEDLGAVPGENTENATPEATVENTEGAVPEAVAENTEGAAPEAVENVGNSEAVTPPVVDVAAELQNINVSLDEGVHDDTTDASDLQSGEIESSEASIDSEPLIPTVQELAGSEETENVEEESTKEEQKEETVEETVEKPTEEVEDENDTVEEKEEEKDSEEDKDTSEEVEDKEESVIPELDLTKSVKSKKNEEVEEEEDHEIVDIFKEEAEKENENDSYEEEPIVEDRHERSYSDDIDLDLDRDYSHARNYGSNRYDDFMSSRDSSYDISSDSYSDDTSTNTFMDDVTKSMSKLVRQNKEQRSTISQLEGTISSLDSKNRALNEKNKDQAQKIEVLSSKLRNLDSLTTRLDEKNREKDRRIESLQRTVRSLKEQINGKRDLVNILHDAQQLLDDRYYDSDDSYMGRAI